jgi:hypothetical protein
MWLATFVLPLMVAGAVLPSKLARGGADENGFPSESAFFPIAVWMQPPRVATSYKAMGVNTYVGLWEGPTEEQLAELARNGMYVVAAQNEIGLNSPNRGIIKGWLHQDEPDNGQVAGLGRFGPCVPADEIVRRSRSMRARDASRPVMVNFGRGVADPLWPGRGTCTGDEAYYDIAIQDADVLSFDIYPVGSDTPRVKGKLEYVAQGVANLVKRAKPGQRVWTLIETTALDPARPVKPEELRSEVWMALIHGATGITYFVHEWANGFREDGIFRHPDIVREVAKVDRTIASLAPILNGPDLTGKVSVSSSVPIALMAKRGDDALYLFCVAMQNKLSTARFAISGLATAQADVIDEGRTVKVSGGVLEDDFDGYGVHLYKIPVSDMPRTPSSERRP